MSEKIVELGLKRIVVPVAIGLADDCERRVGLAEPIFLLVVLAVALDVSAAARTAR